MTSRIPAPSAVGMSQSFFRSIMIRSSVTAPALLYRGHPCPRSWVIARQHVARPIHLLPFGYRRSRAFARPELGTLDERVFVYVARAVRKHLANRNDDDELRFCETRRYELGRLDSCRAVHAQPFRRSEIDEQHSDVAGRGHVTHRQIHA